MLTALITAILLVVPVAPASIDSATPAAATAAPSSAGVMVEPLCI